MDIGFGNYLAGLIDGEGCFMLNKQTQHKHLENFYYPRFALHLRADEMPILLQIKEFIGAGKVFLSHDTFHRSPMAMYQIDSAKDCMKLVNILDICPLRAKKSREYLIWRTCVILKLNHARHAYFTTAHEELKKLKVYVQGSETIISAPVMGEGIVHTK